MSSKQYNFKQNTELIKTARRRLLNDPEFYAVVYHTAYVCIPREMFPEEEIRNPMASISMVSAAVAIILRERQNHGER